MASANTVSILKRWWPFAALCVAVWLRANFNDSVPDTSSTLASQALGCSLAALLAVFLTAGKRTCHFTAEGFEGFPRTALAGVLLLCGPETVLFLRPAVYSASGLAMALTLVPVVVAVMESASGRTNSISTTALWPGIAAAAGLLLLLPEPSITNLLSDVTLALSAILTGIGCVLISGPGGSREACRAFGALTGAAIVFAVTALGYAALDHHLPAMPSLWAVCADFVFASLGVLAALQLQPGQYAARYVIAPLIVIVDGLVLIHVSLTWRSALGILVLVAASAALLRGKNDDETTKISLLR